MQAYTVASGIVIDDQRLLLVQNRRRNGSLDWSTPGGVVDPGEEVLDALSREVTEETALTVSNWSSMFYAVEAEFAVRGLTLRAEIFRADLYSGELAIDDPDDVVVDGEWVGHHAATERLASSPRWVAEPLQHALEALLATGDPAGCPPPADPIVWRYRIDEAPVPTSADPTKLARSRRDLSVVLLQGPTSG